MTSSSPSIFCAQCLSKLDHLSNPPVLGPSDIITSRIQNPSNLPLSPNEITQIDTFLVEASESFTEYDNAIAEIEGLLISLKNSRDKLQRRCDSARSLTSAPIRRLPLDVLHEIFTFVCEMEAPDEAHYGASSVYTLYMAEEISCPTLKLTWVCSLWRTFVQSCPILWSSIGVSAVAFESRRDSFQILVKYLSHSADSLLDFGIFARNASASDPMVSKTIELFLGCSTRWRQAVLWVPDHEFLSKAAACSSIESSSATQLGSFPVIESLNIMGPKVWSTHHESFFQRFALCPRLRVVELSAFSWSGHNADMSCVTRLIIHRFVGSFGSLLRRLPALELLGVDDFELSEDDPDRGWPRSEMENYRSSLKEIAAPYSVFQPEAWRFIRLPRLTDLSLEAGIGPFQNLSFLSSVLDDSQCQLENLYIRNNRVYDAQSQKAIHDFIASQNSLAHLAIYSFDIYPFVEFLKNDVLRNLQSLGFNAVFSYNSRVLASICDVVESRCTVLHFPDGNSQISGLQALTLHANNDHDPYFSSSVHDRLSLLKEAGFKLDGNFLK